MSDSTVYIAYGIQLPGSVDDDLGIELFSHDAYGRTEPPNPWTAAARVEFRWTDTGGANNPDQTTYLLLIAGADPSVEPDTILTLPSVNRHTRERWDAALAAAAARLSVTPTTAPDWFAVHAVH